MATSDIMLLALSSGIAIFVNWKVIQPRDNFLAGFIYIILSVVVFASEQIMTSDLQKMVLYPAPMVLMLAGMYLILQTLLWGNKK